MPQRPVTRARGFLSRGALLSLLLHVNLFGPLMLAAWIYGGREEARRAEEVDVAFEDVSAADLPKDLPPVESPPPDPLDEKQKPTPPKPEERRRKDVAQAEKQPKKPPEKRAEAQKPEPEVVVPPLPPMPEPRPPDSHKAREKVVDLDNDKEVEAPPDARYLAQKNNRAEVETRATNTTLEKAESQHENLPGGEKDKIAELEDQKSAAGRKAPDVTPHADPQVAERKQEVEPERRSLLALRDPAPRMHELTPETADLSLPRAADGELARPSPAVRGDKGTTGATDKKVKLALTGKDYEYLFGADAEAERRLASKQRSTKQGKFQQRLARVQAALENFIPEVRPGNTTALNTRAAPFAVYISRMHRSIHKLWGFGQLEDWDEMSGSSPFNKPNLHTTLEMVLNRDGTVDKITIVHSSGYLPYDAAAIDVAYSAGPYPDPPREIRSPNGKIYVHWNFYRDERQCTPAFTDYFIVEQPGGKTSDKPDLTASAEGEPHPLGAAAAGVAGTTPVGPTSAVAPRALGAAPAGAAGAASAGATPAGAAGPPLAAAGETTAGGPRQLRRFDGGAHRMGMQRLDQQVAAAEEKEGVAGATPAPGPTPPVAHPDDPEAHKIAERWFGALAAADTKTLGDLAVLPFKTSGKEVAKRATLATMLADLVQEGSAGGSGEKHPVQVFTGAGLRAAIGKLPPNLDDGNGAQLYAITSTSAHDTLILILGQRGGVWKPVGLVRR